MTENEMLKFRLDTLIAEVKQYRTAEDAYFKTPKDSPVKKGNYMHMRDLRRQLDYMVRQYDEERLKERG